MKSFGPLVWYCLLLWCDILTLHWTSTSCQRGWSPACHNLSNTCWENFCLVRVSHPLSLYFIFMYVLLVSSWARYLLKPLSLTLSPNRWRNSSSAGPADSLLYISSSLLWPAMQYITPTFRWKLSYRENRERCNQMGRHKYKCMCRNHVRVTMLTF